MKADDVELATGAVVRAACAFPELHPELAELVKPGLLDVDAERIFNTAMTAWSEWPGMSIEVAYYDIAERLFVPVTGIAFYGPSAAVVEASNAIDHARLLVDDRERRRLLYTIHTAIDGLNSGRSTDAIRAELARRVAS